MKLVISQAAASVLYLYSSSSLPLTSGFVPSPYIRQQKWSPSSSSLKMVGDSFPTLDQWSINSKGGVTGTVVSSPIPEIEIGEVLNTSKLRTNPFSLADGAVVQTASGSKYRLGSKKGTSPSRAAAAGTQKIGKPAPPEEISIPIIEDWSLTKNGEIQGAIFNSGRSELPDGEDITTSMLFSRRGLRKGATVTTVSGSNYQLGVKKGAKKSAPVPVSTPAAPAPAPAPVSVSSPSAGGGGGFSFFGGNKKEDIVEEVPAPAPAEKKKPSGFNLFGTKEKEDIVSDVQEVVAAESPKKNRPAPFASVGRGITKGAGRDVPPPEEKVPVLDNWFVNRREQVVGRVSNSSDPKEKNGRTITTGEVATNMEFVVEGFTVVTMEGKKYKLGEPKGGSKRDFNDEMDGPQLLVDWEVVGNMQLKGTTFDGSVITTDTVISEEEFVKEGFTIVTESGKMFKLGGKSKGKKKRTPAPFGSVGRGLTKGVGRDTPATSASTTPKPEVSLPRVSAPKFSNPFEGFGKSESTAPKQETDVGGTRKIQAPVPSATPVKDPIPTLNEWSVNSRKQVTGTISNSFDRDGEILTTSEIDSMVPLKAGSVVYTKSGSGYRLGKRTGANINPFLGRPATNSNLPMLSQWAITPFGGVTGTVSNCPDPDVEDGEILTTSKLQTDIEVLKEGQTVVTLNGSKYMLGARRKVSPPVESPPTDYSGGLWVIAVLTFLTFAGEFRTWY